MIKTIIKNVLPKSLVTNTRHILVNLKAGRNEYPELDRNKKKVVIFLAPDYGNLGDIAIGYAQKRFLSKQFSDYELIEVPLSSTYSNTYSLKRKMNKDDIVTIIGGGNIGNLYQGIEDMRKYVISQFPNNKIISFPQTIDFTDDEKGKDSLSETARVYGKHKDLLIFTREQKSYDVMLKVFPKNQVTLVPDIVLSLEENNDLLKRNLNEVTFCIRNDDESILDGSLMNELKSYIESTGKNVSYSDTHIGDKFYSSKEGETELKKIWNTFGSSSMVVTDRLHGMIFCVITGTPCIALNNSNGKVLGVFDKWIKGSNYIYVLDNPDINSLKDHVSLLNDLTGFERKSLRSDFDKMHMIVDEYVKKK